MVGITPPLLGDKHSEGAGWAPGLLRSLLLPRSRWGPAGLTVRSPLSFTATLGRGAAVPGSGSQRWACAGEWGGVGMNGIVSHRTRWFCLCVCHLSVQCIEVDHSVGVCAPCFFFFLTSFLLGM